MTKNYETFEDVKADVFTRARDAIEDEKNELQEKIKAYYLEYKDTDWLNMFEDWLYETENNIAENLSMYYVDAWNIVNLARFAWTEEDRQYYWDAVNLVEDNATVEGMTDFDALMTMICFHLVDALARDEVTKQLEPFVSKVIQSLETETQNA